MTEVLRSVYDNNTQILQAILSLYVSDMRFDCDITYGNGAFYREIAEPRLKYDIDPQVAGVVAASSDNLPLAEKSISSIVFDPPFLTYVRAGREGNGNMAMSKRYAGYWRYDELSAHYIATLRECSRVLKTGGVMVFKCQDIIHNHKMHCTHASVITWASQFRLTLEDLFVLSAKNRMPSPNRAGTQKHARIFHSYFLVFRMGA